MRHFRYFILFVITLCLTTAAVVPAFAQERLWSFGGDSYDSLFRGTWGTPQGLSVGVSKYFTGVVQAEGGGNGCGLVLLKDGTVWAIGVNDGYQYGDHLWGGLGIGDRSSAVVPMQVPGLSNVKQISFGDWNNAAIKDDGTVWASGQMTQTKYFVQVPGITDVKQVVCSAPSILFLKNDGTIWGMGYPITYNPTPIRVSDLTNVKQIEYTQSQFFAIKDDGTLWAWGSNYLGQLGDGTTTDRAAPVQVTGVSNVVQVICGGDNTKCLCADGTVWCWGDNNWGQLGNSDPAYLSQLSPYKVPNLKDVVEIGGRAATTIVRKKDGTVWTWGYGPLGDGSTNHSNHPIQVPGITRAIRVFTCGYNSYIIALPVVKTVAVSPAAVPGGSVAKATVTIDPPASLMGEVVALSTTDAALVPVPASLNFASGSATAIFNIPTPRVAANQSATIKATYAGSSKTKVITVTPPTVSSITLNPNSVAGGANTVATVTMSAAPFADVTITLGSTNPSAHTPATLVIPADSTSGTFNVTTDPVGVKTMGNITATQGTVTVSTSLTVNAVTPASVTLSSMSVTGGTTVTGTIALTAPVPVDTVVSLTSANTKAHVGASVTVPAGASSATFSITTDPTAAAASGAISATLNGATKSATLKVIPPVLVSLTLSPTTVQAGASGTVTVLLSGPLAANTPVTTTISGTAGAWVTSVSTLPAGVDHLDFDFGAYAGAKPGTATIKFTMGSVMKTAAYKITP